LTIKLKNKRMRFLMKKTNLTVTSTIALMLILTSCVEKTTNKKSSTSSTQSTVITPTTDPGDSNPDPVYEDPTLPNYYSLPIVAVHGTANPNRNPPPNGIFWASNRNVGSNNQYIFQTDSRLNLRVKALDAPTANSTDSNGMECTQRPLNYTKLQVNVCVRSASGSCVSEHSFTDVQVGSFSPVKEFNVPANTNEPLVIEVKDVKWNYDYIYYGYANGGYQDVTEMYAVWYKDCVRFQIEFATDETKDIPGPRY
jgi:hypothetical protein